MLTAWRLPPSSNAFSTTPRATLAVTFVSGKKYLYADVPPDVATELQTAPSIGQYFNWRIRDQYEFREIE